MPDLYPRNRESGMLMLVKRSDGDQTEYPDGAYALLQIDEEGRLKVATKPASIDPSIGDLAALIESRQKAA